MQRKRARSEHEQYHQIARGERLRLEHRLEHGHVHERELRREGDAHCPEQHLVLPEPAAEPAVLHGGDEVEEHEAGECL